MPTVDELRARVKPSGPWFDVPAGTPEAECSRCDADGLYWSVTKNGKKLLVDVNVAGGLAPPLMASSAYGGRGVAHFATCPHAAAFSKRGKK